MGSLLPVVDIKKRPICVFLGNLRDGQGPVDLEGRIVITKATLARRGVEFSDHIVDFSVVSERLVADRKHPRNIKCPAIFRRELKLDMFEIGWRVLPKVNYRVENRTSRASNILRLQGGSYLEVHPSKGALHMIKGHVALAPDGIKAMRFEFARTEGASKKTPMILSTFNIDEE